MFARAWNRVVPLLILAVALGLSAAAAHAQTVVPSSDAAKITQLLKASGYHYEQKKDTVWAISFTGKSLKEFKVVMSTQDNLVVTFVTVATKAQFQVTPEFLRALLRFNHTLDRVKVGLDDDGDMFVRCDSTVRIMDGEELKAVVEQVAAAADEVHKGLSAFLPL